MARIRTLATVALLGAAAALVPAATASAATPLEANIVCDDTGAVTTWVSGKFLVAGSPTSVTVEFQRRSAVNITAAGARAVAPLPQPFTVTVQSTSDGEVDAAGYTGSFDATTSLSYRETVVVTLTTAAGAHSTVQATCQRDVRNTVSLSCDPVAGTVTAATVGRDANGAGEFGEPARVAYRYSSVYEDEDGIRWGRSSDGWDATHSITPAADGSWADTGYVHTHSSDRYYYEELTVEIYNRFGNLIGGGSAECTLGDG
jgi:hypothetical protein